MSEEELKSKLSSEEESKNARDFKIAREKKRQLDYGYNDNFTKYVNPEYYKRMGAIARRQRVNIEDKLKDKNYIESAARGIINSEEKSYKENQKIEIQSGPKSINMIENKSKLESEEDQMAAKITLNTEKSTLANENALTTGAAIKDVASQALEMAKEQVKEELKKQAKKRIKTWLLAWAGELLVDPIFWSIIIIIIILGCANYYFSPLDFNSMDNNMSQAMDKIDNSSDDLSSW